MKTFNEEKTKKEITDSESTWGIDISHHQKKINWDELVKHNKPDFIFLKCTEGASHQDTKYNTYKNKAEQYNIVIGAYHFSNVSLKSSALCTPLGECTAKFTVISSS